MAGHRFFLSYARQDREQDPNGAIDRFYAELIDDIRSKTGLDPDEIGFLDTHDVGSGTQWPGAVEGGLRTCDVFVPVLSRTLLSRPYCGKEWSAFAGRLQAGMNGGEPPPLIQPVLFVGEEWLTGMPEVVNVVDYSHDTYPADYLKLGLKKLQDLGEARTFSAFVDAFGTRLLEVIEQHPLPAADAIPSLEELANAFATRSPEEASTSRGAGWIKFILVAPHRHERQADWPDLYGNDARDWHPWRPEFDDSLPMITMDLAHSERLVPEWLEADDTVVAQIDEAFASGKLVVVLIDPWALRIEQRQRRVQPLDTRDFMHCITAVLWNDGDPATTAARAQLETQLRVTLANKCAGHRPQSFFDHIGSPNELHDRLSPALALAAAHVRDHQELVRRAGDATSAPPPISGPGGTN